VTRVLVHNLKQAFDGRAWHGTPLARSLAGVTVKQALWRPGRRRHNIWELVLHTAFWKYMVRRRLLRLSGERFPRRGANWPRLPMAATPRAFADDVRLLRDQHDRLHQAVARFPASQLGRRRGQWTALEQILGIASHDLYHCGQIQLIKKLQKVG
jgi:hypothetical protein